jgi:hypothetical protein
MADAPAPPAKASGGSSFGFLSRKLGPLPVWAYALIIVAAYYWYTHYGPGASSSSTAQQGATSPIIIVGGSGGGGDADDAHGGGGGGGGKQKKPGPQGSWKTITVPKAWNGWTLDRIAKYLHWDPQTLADVEKANARGGKEITGKTTFHTGDTLLRPLGAAKDESADAAPSGSGQPGAAAKATPSAFAGTVIGATSKPEAAQPGGVLATYQPYNGQNQWKTATGWEAAAINYLIGEGVPPDEASTSVYAYQHSEPLSSRMQANVTLAQDGIGPPPGQPAPAMVTTRVPPRNTPRKPSVVKAAA